MKTLFYYVALCTILLLQSCSSSELVENWKNPDIDVFVAEKVLVLAMTNDVKNRKMFEKRLVDQLKDKGVNAVNSDDFFNPEFTSRPRTEGELDDLEREMLAEGFDAILVSKIVGAEDKVTLVQSYRNWDRTFNGFEDDYYSSQGLYIEDEKMEKYTVYHAESALYCICPTKEREVIWKGSIDVTEPDSDRKAIKDYINMLVWALEEQDLLIITPEL
ncbi:hypothetical protein EAX61_01610 [Dokdonia sinensis]|uniref:Cardiolipin synthetase n=1 Tax=Dokdonia sinensis TaxID=2479847 RepID=A0A3M0GIK1_9FLAO|nr:hypothetical protein [Dokdonia sinensis]RMB64098.1 hypothetical protein EAX61_01610 [Dokdonia sinensis]